MSIEGSILKTIGTKKKEVDASQVYVKLYALKEMIPALMTGRNNEGSLRKGRMDDLIYGIHLLFEDALTEFDQMFLEGAHELTEAELKTLRVQEAESLRGAPKTADRRA